MAHKVNLTERNKDYSHSCLALVVSMTELLAGTASKVILSFPPNGSLLALKTV